ncbi:hypothetical protein BESB_046060 [Besnoitia besnoiti]|uniref:Uncharacterized protein n=1 Tax=Besnoitia besnoiti TaxID=94643 RepID=A0A2A9MGY2_BESBE|nr:hypothetical protein BESB_046060 [Besnoitia besnoiti]PFH36414.1 hypothetical protein BESB_046060 [Besnoitia besnoiti]
MRRTDRAAATLEKLREVNHIHQINDMQVQQLQAARQLNLINEPTEASRFQRRQPLIAMRVSCRLQTSMSARELGVQQRTFAPAFLTQVDEGDTDERLSLRPLQTPNTIRKSVSSDHTEPLRSRAVSSSLVSSKDENEYGNEVVKTRFDKSIEEMRAKLEMLKAGESFAFLVSVKERESENVQRLLTKTKAEFLSRMDICNRQREVLESRRDRFKQLILTCSRLLQRNIEKAHQSMKLSTANIWTIRQADEKISLLTMKIAQMEAKCRHVEQAAMKLAPIKVALKAVGGACLIATVIPHCSSNSGAKATSAAERRRVRRALEYAENLNAFLLFIRFVIDRPTPPERLERNRLQCNERQLQGSNVILNMASRSGELQNHVDRLRQNRQELEQAVATATEEISSDTAAIGAICASVQVLHTRLHQSRFAPRTYTLEEPSASFPGSKKNAAPLSRFLDVLQAIEQLKQIADLAYKYKAMIWEADTEREKLRRRAQRAVQDVHSASASPLGRTPHRRGRLAGIRPECRGSPSGSIRAAATLPRASSCRIITKADSHSTPPGESGRSSPKSSLLAHRRLSVGLRNLSAVTEDGAVEFVFIPPSAGQNRAPPHTPDKVRSTALCSTSVSRLQATSGSQLHFRRRSKQTLASTNKTESSQSAALSNARTAGQKSSWVLSSNVTASPTGRSASQRTRQSFAILTAKARRKNTTATEQAPSPKRGSSRRTTAWTKAALQQQRRRESMLQMLPQCRALGRSAAGKRSTSSPAANAQKPKLLHPSCGRLTDGLQKLVLPR